MLDSVSSPCKEIGKMVEIRIALREFVGANFFITFFVKNSLVVD